MSEASLYEQVLAQVAGGSGGGSLVASPPPRASASIVPWRGSGAGLELYWVKRSPTMKFMGGWHAFPGGGVSKRDVTTAVRGEPAGLEGAPLEAAMPESVLDGIGELTPVLAPGVVAAALREAFEEIGILPGLTIDGARLLEARRRLVGRESTLDGIATELEIELDASRLSYAGRWLTPPLGPVRFDNRFFLLEWSEAEPLQPVIDGDEIVEGEWIRPLEALDRWRRGKVIAAPPILHLLRVMAEDGPVAGRARLLEPEEANLGAFRNVEFRPGVVLLPVRTPTLPPAAFTNCYLLGFESAVLVDPGSPFEREIDWLEGAVAAAEERLGRRVGEIWLTHHHPDHVGGAMALRERCGLPIAAHADTAARLEGQVTIDRWIEDGETTRLGEGFTVRALHTPGHARGHLAFLHEELGSLLTGDVVAGFGTIVIDPPEGDMAQYLETLTVLEELGPRTLFPAHGPTLLDAVGTLAEYRQHRLWREERVFDAWQGGERELGDLRAAVYEDLSPMAFPLAERQVSAHLERLRALGRIDA